MNLRPQNVKMIHSESLGFRKWDTQATGGGGGITYKGGKTQRGGNGTESWPLEALLSLTYYCSNLRPDMGKLVINSSNKLIALTIY
jgi:hypothetical protein